MSFAAAVAREMMIGSSNRSPSPEFRQIELGGARRPILSFAEPDLVDPETVVAVAGVCRACAGLEVVFDADRSWDEERPQRALFLPRTRAERAAGELYRRMRLVRMIAFRPAARIEQRDALVYLGIDVGKEIHETEITVAGLRLLELAASKLVEFRDAPYPDAWVEAYVTTLLADATGETRAFHDEDDDLRLFRPPFPFNRHQRFDNENPRSRFVDDALEIDIPEAYTNAAVFAIDFHVVVGDLLHLIPVEALMNGRLPRNEIDRWRARVPDGRTLPADFRRRFTRASRADPPSKRL